MADKGDAAQEALEHLLSKKENVAALHAAYQTEFDKNPVVVVERLLKLLPKGARKSATDSPPPIGIDLVLTNGSAKPKRKRKEKKT